MKSKHVGTVKLPDPFRRAVLMTVFLATITGTSNAAVVVKDAIGDAIGIHDIDSVVTELTQTGLIFTVNFVDSISPPFNGLPNGIQAFIDLDTDRNNTTGAVAQYSVFIGGSDLRTEYFVDTLDFVPGLAEIVDTETAMTTATAPITYADRSFTVTLALADIGGGSGLLNYGVIVGPLDTTFPTDDALGTTVPEPSSLLLLALGGVLTVGSIPPFSRCRTAV